MYTNAEAPTPSSRTHLRLVWSDGRHAGENDEDVIKSEAEGCRPESCRVGLRAWLFGIWNSMGTAALSMATAGHDPIETDRDYEAALMRTAQRRE